MERQTKDNQEDKNDLSNNNNFVNDNGKLERWKIITSDSLSRLR